MPYFLDGNNLIGRVRRSARPTEDDRSALVAEIGDRLRRSEAKVVLFFDGSGERKATLGNLSIRGSQGESADDAILAEVARADVPGEIIVVTQDQDLSRRARDGGAKTLTPGEFWSRLGARSPSAARPAAPRVDVDVDEWMRYFGDEKNRQR